MIQTAMDSLSSFLGDVQKKPLSNLSNPSSRAQTRHVETAEKYMSARLAGRNDEILRLVSDDVKLESSRDGTVVGADNFSSYLSRVKPTGNWKPATWNKAMGKAEVQGNVRILMINVPVIAHFGFNRGGKINQIYVGTKKKAPS